MDDTTAQPKQDDERFDPEALTGRVTPAGMRYLTHAIETGVVPAAAVDIEFSGHVRLKPNGRWMSFRATETVRAGHSYEVTAKARRGPLTARIDDSYRNGKAHSRVRAVGIIPVRSQHDANLARSARGRLVVESTWLPSTFMPSPTVTWRNDPEGEYVDVVVDGQEVEAKLAFGGDGRLEALHLLRWSNFTDSGEFGWVPFRASVTSERSYGGYTIPSEVTASWRAGLDGEFEFFRAVVTDARFRS